MASVEGIISADGLTKCYGRDRGVEDLSFPVAQGEVFGFLGPNGAGKTTTIRTMLDFIRPTSGAVRRLRPGPSPRRRPSPSTGGLPARASSPCTNA